MSKENVVVSEVNKVDTDSRKALYDAYLKEYLKRSKKDRSKARGGKKS